ncbi:MAG: sugar phosphate isomerase/epimerase family protein [Bacteroidota bacterium]
MTPILLTDTVSQDLDRVLGYAGLWGVEGIELRTIGGVQNRVPHVNERKLTSRLLDYDFPVLAIAPSLFEGLASDKAGWMNELAALPEILQFCRRVQCKTVVVSGFAEEEIFAVEWAAEALQRAGEASARVGVTLAVLNEPAMAHVTGAALADLLDLVDHEHVRAAWSPMTAWQAGEDPSAGLAELAHHVHLVRCRDAKREGDTWADTTLGEGGLGWSSHLAQLRRTGFEGLLSLEVFTDKPAKSGLRSATNLIRLARG